MLIMGRLLKSDIKKIFSDSIRHEGEELLRIAEQIDKETAVAVADEIESCKGKIITAGCGTSGVAARKIAHTLSCVGVQAFYLIPSDANHGGMGVVKHDDLLILVSKGGNTSELETIAESSKKKGCRIVFVTENPESILAEWSDIVFKIKINSESDRLGVLATTSTMAVIAAFDAIAVVIEEETSYSGKDFLLNHPGGEVGQILKNEQN